MYTACHLLYSCFVTFSVCLLRFIISVNHVFTLLACGIVGGSLVGLIGGILDNVSDLLLDDIVGGVTSTLAGVVSPTQPTLVRLEDLLPLQLLTGTGIVATTLQFVENILDHLPVSKV